MKLIGAAIMFAGCVWAVYISIGLFSVDWMAAGIFLWVFAMLGLSGVGLLASTLEGKRNKIKI